MQPTPPLRPVWRVKNLTCEYFDNPLGLDVARPRLSWHLVSDRPGARQTAYRVMVASGANQLETGKADLWDSGRVRSDQSVHVEYGGVPLASRQRAWWKVVVEDETGVEIQSAPAWWEMGLLARADWQAQWIGAPWAGGPKTSSPCPLLRKPFAVDRPVAAARLYVTALGLYEFRLNGERVGDEVFAPGWTDYGKRLQYQVYDVTGLLRPGANAMGAILGDGWYCGFAGWFDRQSYGNRPKLLAQLAVGFADGTLQTFPTDPSWKTAFGPILESDLMMGESYDARRDLPGWDAPGFADARWWPVEMFADPGIELGTRRGPPVRRMQELRTVAPPVQRGPSWIFDLGQNFAGRVRLKVTGPAGKTVTIRHAEMLDRDGSLYTVNLRAARATDHYTLNGDGLEVWEPRFTFHGFRYVEVTGYPGEPGPDAVTGVVLHSDTPVTGEFECSDPLVNQLQHNIQWGQRSNFLEAPTDCPQRNERLGWTGDAQVFCRTAAFNMDVAGFFTKWLTDLADAQMADGDFPPYAPTVREPPHPGGPAWADAAIICPWTIHLCYGDTRLVAGHYDRLARFLECLRDGSKDLIRGCEGGGCPGYGDWLALDGSGATSGGTPKDLIGTAFFAQSARLLGRMAAMLDRKADAAKYERLFEDVRRAFQKRFVAADGRVGNQTQTSYVLALHFDLLPRELRAPALDRLVQDIEQRGDQLSTGFVGTSYLPFVLSDNGRLDVAYRLLFQKQCPSWLYAVSQGATTIWERWNGWTPDQGFYPTMNSFNHYAYGAIGAWLYAVVAGLDLDPDRPGFKHLRIQPQPGGGLTRARARLRTPYGDAESAWRIEDGRFVLDVQVPANATAAVRLPDGSTHQTGSGRYQFAVPYPAG